MYNFDYKILCSVKVFFRQSKLGAKIRRMKLINVKNKGKIFLFDYFSI